VTVQTALLEGADILTKAAISAPRLTAEVLLSHALHCDKSFLYAHGGDELAERAWIHYGRYLNERLAGKPTQYITCRQEFYGREFYVNPNVLIPRPETEHLVEAALEFLSGRAEVTVLDVGTGSGAIAISIALESRHPVLASDISLEALAVARRNAATLHAPVSLFAADLVVPIAPSSIDLLVSNPPYVPGGDAANMQKEVREWEPHVALFAGDSGLEIYRRLLTGAERVLKPGGRVLMELGYQSLDGVRELLSDCWTDVEVRSDLAGWPRVIGATLRNSG
jgi:release factor glutamine methyltransferase